MQNKLKDLRIAKGLTQLELARKLPIDTGILTGRVSAISKIETGCALPTYHFREAIAAVLGCQPEEICDAVDGNQLTRRTEIAEEMIKKREKKIKKRVAEAEHLQSIGHCKGCKCGALISRINYSLRVIICTILAGCADVRPASVYITWRQNKGRGHCPLPEKQKGLLLKDIKYAGEKRNSSRTAIHTGNL